MRSPALALKAPIEVFSLKGQVSASAYNRLQKATGMEIQVEPHPPVMEVHPPAMAGLNPPVGASLPVEPNPPVADLFYQSVISALAEARAEMAREPGKLVHSIIERYKENTHVV